MTKKFEYSLDELENIQIENGGYVARYIKAPAIIAILFPLIAAIIVVYNLYFAISLYGFSAFRLMPSSDIRPFTGIIGFVFWIYFFSYPAIKVIFARGYALSIDSEKLNFFGQSIARNDVLSFGREINGIMGRFLVVFKDGTHVSHGEAYVRGMPYNLGLK